MKVEVDDYIVERGFLEVRSLIKKKRSQKINYDDSRNVWNEFEISSGESISVIKYNHKYYKYEDMEVDIDPLDDVELHLRDIYKDHDAEPKHLSLAY